ncbi:MAG: glycosyltransferase [Desulfobulbaceae bacterium]|jgi:exo-beta-1,3-glucanase (GH17 family)/cellulose synthase/poly-beta-1,6-N-acetylglucosamine synthase-like glycosyltransferase|nr:glycosyltransferase [Desulfobulbaceae bacterium]
MNRSRLVITCVMAVLSVALWMIANRPDNEPPWPQKIQGFSFMPYRDSQSAEKGQYPTVAQIDEDLALLSGKVDAVRTYTVANTIGQVPALAAKRNLNVALGAWINRNPAENEVELAKLVEVYRDNHQNITRVLVGNEVLLRADQTVEQMIRYIEQVRRSVWAPISLAEPYHIWLEHPELVEHVDYIAVHLLPYWEGVAVEDAISYVVNLHRELEKRYPDKPILISEVGWPSNGRTYGQAVASLTNEAKFLRRFLKTAADNGYSYYIMEAFDQRWKEAIEGEAGSHWGVYDNKRQPKFAFVEPVVRVPQWQGLAVVGILLSMGLLLLLFRDSDGLNASGQGFLALIAYLMSTFAVWVVYDFSQRYMSPAAVLVSVVMFLAALGALMVIMAEAHEWAEAMWTKKWRRMPAAPEEPSGGQAVYAPKVSIHVPAYNEPPEMLNQTLDALSRLDYPDFEVLVIDNNTKDEAVWRPVEAHCRELGERFRFFHVAPLAGFKAGALNFALRETNPEAEVVAVIDSDYIILPSWLKVMIPQFRQPNMAIVQGPQDYRDGGENAFKAMCNAEYRGFFNIGMVTRNERNAIIQHGTMTMVRRRVLEEVGGWSEWCITEDAELGLRIFEKGYDATYLPHSFGQGLIPDTFLDFKKQRFRWAYGAVIILRQHMMKLLGLEKSRLTRGQRYHFWSGWLPWFADGINLIFNVMAILWSVGMVFFPDYVYPPHTLFAILPLSLFVFKSLKMFFLYHRNVAASFRQSLAAALAGLALSHTIARAMLTGFITSKIGFFRTPKNAQANALARALANAREELIFAIALLVSMAAILSRKDGMLLDIRIWAAVLFVQSVPYLAAVTVSIISGMPKLPASLIGVMPPLRYKTASAEPAKPEVAHPTSAASSQEKQA